ncbi:hypothetical protein EPA93_06820 [Ktedonosporobacter rubrisoli]|uniref:HTH luxR-type domain-containing protein n=1 Tax=Ktedonosporobacter rubrisoli TaxID=2509675 RepID=A0A4P6JKP3_KTERU|nr:LuxR C-terminal-related transcriptional regulator [Ktedonosporobacter rubrisoli]QBD75734.1 hypothetical protein EPA93_06820 [Ktedonosporobacter rubrisoli]
MPRAATYVLTWLPEQVRYGLFAQKSQEQFVFYADDAAWLSWLATHRAFSFQGQHGERLNLLKEARTPGKEGYWYAYRRQGGRKLKRYAGRSANLTPAHLEDVARAFAGHDEQNAAALPEADREELANARLQEASATSQPPSLLVPKLLLPRLPSELVPRQHLLARLNEGLGRKLTVITAPAGFGKTTLVRQWIEASAKLDHFPPVAWVSLDPEDDDPLRFWHYVLTAMQTLPGAPGRAALAHLSALRPPLALSALKAVLTVFLNELAPLSGRRLLVLEDYHVIIASQLHEALAFMLDHLPPSLSLVLLSRSDPPLPVARWRARGELLEIQASELRFSHEETATFLQQALPFAPAPETLARLEAHLEGWVAGLRLLALALQNRSDPQEIEQVLAAFTGGHRYLHDYFAGEVLGSQSETLQSFLLQTSILSRMCPSLCDAVTGRDDSAQILEAAERAGLFLQSLDGAGPWYRYHLLFAEALRTQALRQLGAQALQLGLNKASAWYEEHEMAVEAVEMALQAREWSRAALLMERYLWTQKTIERYDVTTLRWLEQLPEQVLEKHPELCLIYVMVLMFSQDRSSPETMSSLQRPLAMAEHYFEETGDNLQLGAVQSIYSLLTWWQGKLPQSLAAARRALTLLPEHETLWRNSALIITGGGELYAGRLDRARQMASEAYSLFLTTEANTYGMNAAIMLLNEVCFQQGELHQAAHYLRQLLDSEDPPDQGYALLGLARLSYEWNDLKAAEQQARQVLALAQLHSDELGRCHAELFLQIPGSLVLARVLFGLGEILQAQHLVHEMLVLTQERGWLYLQREALTSLARLNLAAGDLPAAQRQLDTCRQLGKEIRIQQREQEALISVRLLIARGECAEALDLLASWQLKAQEQQRRGSELEILVLKARAYAVCGNLAQAVVELKEAVMIGQPEGYQRVFLDEGVDLLPALRALLLNLPNEQQVSYVRDLLAEFAKSQEGRLIPSPEASSFLLEPLSSQEQRVLRLLAAGRSNPEIAKELVVSINTVKTQVQSIYRKLNVKNRWEARATAQRLQLL